MSILGKLFGSDDADTNALVMDEPRPTSFLDGAQDVIGKPIDRVEGPLKVAGRAPYAAEYPAERRIYGVLVRATFGRGKITKIDDSVARALPGVIDVIVDYDTFIRSPGQGGDTNAPTQGVQDVQYFGEPVAVVVGETFEAARDGAAAVRLEYKEADANFVFAAHKDQGKEPKKDQIPGHSKQGNRPQVVIRETRASRATASRVNAPMPSALARSARAAATRRSRVSFAVACRFPRL